MTAETLGNYKLVAKLGSGSMGVVFLAEHQRIARRVAIKLLSPELIREPQVLQRFFNEARATSLIRHPGIVDIFDCDVDPSGRAYMVMEYLEGQTLGGRLRETGSLPWPAACVIAEQVADALGAAHGKAIVHRDLKPDNIFLVGDPEAATARATVKVLDFGVAKLLAVDAQRLTMRGMVIGTPEYMSPEQSGGSEAVDHRADIYALGCILFEMLSGKPPFAASSVQELLIAHRFRSAPSLAAAVPNAPGWLTKLLARMLAKEPAERPASMHEVAKALRDQEPPPPIASAEAVAEGAAPAAIGAESAVVEPAAEPTGATRIERGARDRIAAIVRRVEPRRGQIAFGLAAVVVVACAIWAARGVSSGERRSHAGAATPAVGVAATEATSPPSSQPLETAAQPITNPAVADPLPPEPALEKPARPERRAPPGARPTRKVVDSDGIVDL